MIYHYSSIFYHPSDTEMSSTCLYALLLLALILIPSHGFITFTIYDDFQCSQGAEYVGVNVTSSSSCHAYPDVGVSLTLLCSSVNSTTFFNFTTWSPNILDCSGTPSWILNGTGPEGSCLPMTDILYGVRRKSWARVNCSEVVANVSPSSSFFPSRLLPPSLPSLRG